MTTIITLEKAIIARDEAAILSLTVEPDLFMENGRLMPSVSAILFNGDDLRIYAEDARSAREILMLGEYEVRVVYEFNGGANILFVREQYIDTADDSSFWADRWMRDYFACELHKAGDRWLFVHNICFADSGGPYHRPYGFNRPVRHRFASAGV